METLKPVITVLCIVTGTVFLVIVAIVVTIVAIGSIVFLLAGIISAFVELVTKLYHYFNWNEL